MKIINIELSKLKEYGNNAKAHPDSQIEKIITSIKTFGFNVPVIIDKDYNVIAGHGRILAIRKDPVLFEKWSKIPCLMKDKLTEEQIKAYRIMDNKSAESDWDFELLKIEFNELKGLNIDLDLTGFNESEINDLFLDPPIKEKEVDENIKTEHECPSCGYQW